MAFNAIKITSTNKSLTPSNKTNKCLNPTCYCKRSIKTKLHKQSPNNISLTYWIKEIINKKIKWNNKIKAIRKWKTSKRYKIK
jgi:hypothetical protein